MYKIKSFKELKEKIELLKRHFIFLSFGYEQGGYFFNMCYYQARLESNKGSITHLTKQKKENYKDFFDRVYDFLKIEDLKKQNEILTQENIKQIDINKNFNNIDIINKYYDLLKENKKNIDIIKEQAQEIEKQKEKFIDIEENYKGYKKAYFKERKDNIELNKYNEALIYVNNRQEKENEKLKEKINYLSLLNETLENKEQASKKTKKI